MFSYQLILLFLCFVGIIRRLRTNQSCFFSILLVLSGGCVPTNFGLSPSRWYYPMVSYQPILLFLHFVGIIRLFHSNQSCFFSILLVLSKVFIPTNLAFSLLRWYYPIVSFQPILLFLHFVGIIQRFHTNQSCSFSISLVLSDGFVPTNLAFSLLRWYYPIVSYQPILLFLHFVGIIQRFHTNQSCFFYISLVLSDCFIPTNLAFSTSRWYYPMVSYQLILLFLCFVGIIQWFRTNNVFVPTNLGLSPSRWYYPTFSYQLILLFLHFVGIIQWFHTN